MEDTDIPSIIQEKISGVAGNESVQEFIYEILVIEKTARSDKWKIKDYEEALAKYRSSD